MVLKRSAAAAFQLPHLSSLSRADELSASSGVAAITLSTSLFDQCCCYALNKPKGFESLLASATMGGRMTLGAEGNQVWF